jgi:hypothetical protein
MRGRIIRAKAKAELAGNTPPSQGVGARRRQVPSDSWGGPGGAGGACSPGCRSKPPYLPVAEPTTTEKAKAGLASTGPFTAASRYQAIAATGRAEDQVAVQR